MKVSIIQPAVPAYRQGFFQRLFERLGPEFVVYSSHQKDLGKLEDRNKRAPWHRELSSIRKLIFGFEWQSGALRVPVSRGDIIVVSGAPRTLSTLALLVKCRFKGARTIWWGHYWSATSQAWRASIRLALMKIADATFFYTDQEVDAYRAKESGRSNRVIVALNNGIETGEIARLRAEYKPTERPRDLFIGRVTPKSELALLIDALAHSECVGVTLDVIGEGKNVELLKERALMRGISDRITWHGALVDEPRIAKVANQCKVFVYPGSVGLSLIHGFAYGLPAVVHDERLKHMPEIAAFKAGVNGRTFQRVSTTGLASAIKTLLNDPQLLKVMSREAIVTTEVSFNAADMANRFCSAIEGVART